MHENEVYLSGRGDKDKLVSPNLPSNQMHTLFKLPLFILACYVKRLKRSQNNFWVEMLIFYAIEDN